MARKIVVEIVGDSVGVERAFTRASRSGTGFDRTMSRVTRGTLAGSGAFQHLGRSIAFASGGFLAFASAGDFLRKSIDAARDAAVTQRQLSTQLHASGAAFGFWKDQIDQADLKLSHISGFTSTELEKSLTTLDRATGDITVALKLNTIAADVARGRHISTAQAALALGKAYDGTTTALRRLGIEVPKGLTGMQAITFVAQKFAGQAKAGATAQDRFSAELHNSEVIIGQALLPTLNRYLAKGSDWLDQMNRSGKLQRDVQHAIQDVSAAIQAAKAVLSPFVEAFRLLGDAVGGTKNELKLLADAFVVLYTRTKLIQWGFLTTEVAGVGGAAATSAGEVGALRNSLLGLNGLVIKYAIVQQVIKQFVPGQSDLGIDLSNSVAKDKTVTIGGQSFIKGSIGALQAQQSLNAARSGKTLGPAFPGLTKQQDMSVVRSAPKKTVAVNTSPGSGAGLGAGSSDLSKQQSLQIALAQNPNNVSALQAMAAFDQTQIAALKRSFAAHKIDAATFTKEVTGFYNDFNQQESQLAQLAQDAARKAKAASEKAAREAKTTLERLAASVEAAMVIPFRQFKEFQKQTDKEMGEFVKKSNHFAVPLTLQLAEAMASATATNADDVLAQKAIKASAEKALKSGKLSIQAQIDAWNAIASANSVLGQQATDAMTGFRRVGANAITAGLHLALATRKELDARISQSQEHFGRVPTGIGVLGQSVNVHGPVYVNSETPQQLGDQLRKVGRHSATQRRGHNAGARALR